jgi:hypothetical protein
MKCSATEGEFVPYDARIVGFDYKMQERDDPPGGLIPGRFEIMRNGIVIATVDHSLKLEDSVKLNVNFGRNGVLAVKDSADSPGLNKTNVNVHYRRVM